MLHPCFFAAKGILLFLLQQMAITYSQLLSLAQHFDGKSCEEVYFDPFQWGKEYRMDRVASFKHQDVCCLVKACLWGDDTDGACSAADMQCPSASPTVDPETCQESSDADQEGSHAKYFSQAECCRAKLLLGDLSYVRTRASGCSSSEPWADACCPADDDAQGDDTRQGLHVD